MVIRQFLLSSICCLVGFSAHANQTTLSGWEMVHIQPGTLTTLLNTQQPTSEATQLYVTPGTITSGWKQVSVKKTQASVILYVAEGTAVAGIENIQAKISYVAPKPPSILKTQTEDLPCLPPLPIPHPKEQGNLAIVVISPVKTKEHFSTTDTQVIAFSSLPTTSFQNLRTTNNSYTTHFHPTHLTNLPFLSGFSGLAPPTE